jgi:lipopolysaccharide transport system permease protein
VLNPLAMVVVYTVIFSKVMHAKLPQLDTTYGYSIYLCAGVLTWGLFVEITSRIQNVFLENANLLKKLSFPRLCLPVIVVASGLINFALVFGLFSFFLLFSGTFPGLTFLAIFPITLLLVLFAVGLGMILGVLNVFFRDVGQAFGIFTTFWFWLTPIVYPANLLPDGLQFLNIWNPMSSIIDAVQGALVHGQWPNWRLLSYPLVFALTMCWFGLRLFRRHFSEMMDQL